MKRTLKLLTFALIMATYFSSHAGQRDDLWKLVNEAVQKGLPATAITNLEPIIAGALKDKAYAEAAKAIAKKIALQGNIQGNKPEERITRLEAEIARAPKEMTPVLQTLLAHWYWQYFQQNRWRFLQRTATAQSPGTDFTAWDLPRLFAEIDRHFQQSLAAEKTLKATPISAWDDLIEKGTLPDAWRPTLYDFIAREALDFYTSGEQAAARPQDAFELAADSPIFLAAPEFAAWVDHLGGDTNEAVVRALDLYRDLLRFHQDDPAPRLAFAAADLERLTWGWNTAFGEDKNARYKAALERFSREHADFDISAFAVEREARVIQQEGDLVAAHDLAGRAAKVFPNEPGGQLCHNLVLEIEARSAGITTERVWNAPWPKITVRYRNVDILYFRAIPIDWEMFLHQILNRNSFSPQNMNEEERRAFLAKAPALAWSAKLPPTPDFKEKTFEVNAPQTLKPGHYFIAASHEEGFGEGGNMVSMAEVWVSDLALITRTRGGNIEGFVLNANSGEPVSGAEVSVWHRDFTQPQTSLAADPDLTTDTNGFFSMKPEQNRGYLFRARHNGQEITTAEDIWWYQWNQVREPQPYARTVFFTDRAIYRPGQTIEYKGICIWVDTTANDYKTLKGEPVTVVFSDVNGKEVARQTRQANDYGSFAGSFTAPRDRLMGWMSLRVEGRAQGSVGFHVEEYKRPKFEVTLDAPKTAAKLNESISLTGHAMNYTGAAVDGAQVKYRVVREVRMPWWWFWWARGPQRQSQEIAHGTARTQTDGSFKIEFTAKPDPQVLEKDEPTFVFEINADVTDGAGETRSAGRGIRVGFTALEAMLSADDWQTADKAVELRIETKTLDGEPQTAEGSVKIYELQPPEKAHRAPLGGQNYYPPGSGNGGADGEDLADPNNWPLGKVAAEHAFSTDTNGAAKLSFALGAGEYRAVLETQDRFGKHVTGRLPLRVVQPDAAKLAIRIPHLLAAPKWEAQPGEEFMVLWGTGYDEGRAFVEIEQRHKILQRFWTEPGRTQQQIKLAVTEALRGGFTLYVTQVRENRAYLESRKISVPWKNKELTLAWEHFTSKLLPGQKETWTAVVTGPGAEKAVAEMVAALYDESLDAFAANNWQHGFGVFREEDWPGQAQFFNSLNGFNTVFDHWNPGGEGVLITYRHFPDDLTVNLWGYGYFRRMGGGFGGARFAFAASGAETAASVPGNAPVPMAAPASAAMPMSKLAMDSLAMDKKEDNGGVHGEERPLAGSAPVDLSKVSARKNLNETAFFFPQLMSDSNGVVRLTFAMPEALTKWHFLGFAHDQNLRGGFLEGHAVTAKDIMVQPNPPRFLREGDTVEFTVKVSNQSDKPQTGRVRLNFDDIARAGSPLPAAGAREVTHPVEIDKLLGNAKPEQAFDIPAKESRSFSWRITVPDDAPFLSYKAVAATGELSDGEEGGLPVLSRRIFVRESMPLAIRGPATNKFEFKKLAESGKSKTLQNQGLTVEMASHPAWYAVLALPYLMEFPYECSEQTFNRLYANALARHIANHDPKIRAVFDQWKNTPALDSPLEKNQDLKSVMVEETPWLRQAQNESQARRNVGILFDDNRLNDETDATLRKLTEMQNGDGCWPWFPGGPGNDYITLYIVTGFGRLRHLGADIAPAPAIRALARLDQWMTEHYAQIQLGPRPEDYIPSPTDALYLYGRSFFLKDKPIDAPNKTAVEFFLKQSRKFWLQTNWRQTQGQLAIALQRWGGDENAATATAIMRSIKERSVSNAEMGMFWRDTELSWWWYRAPIETQALMIEAFDEVANDQAAVEDCRVWLLKQKQTQDWKTTKATADAVYALLLRGTDLLSSTALVEVTVGGMNVTPGKVELPIRNPPSAVRNPPEPGTGFYQVRFAPGDIKPKMGEITVRKTDAGVAWGGVHWQYLEDMSKVTPSESTPLQLKKTLFTKVNTARGPVLQPLQAAAAVGDELVVRVELRVDRDMEYVHLKDQRGSGTEPVNVLSQYKYQDGLAYYESTRDTATHFFIDYLPKGVYVFEYSTRVQLRGEYQTGIAEIQCMYAPEFSSHSGSVRLTVK
ncbi:MAG: alpha-2-macroglobulin family protein [Verrucomicrobiota bacterium]